MTFILLHEDSTGLHTTGGTLDVERAAVPAALAALEAKGSGRWFAQEVGPVRELLSANTEVVVSEVQEPPAPPAYVPEIAIEIVKPAPAFIAPVPVPTPDVGVEFSQTPAEAPESIPAPAVAADHQES